MQSFLNFPARKLAFLICFPVLSAFVNSPLNTSAESSFLQADPANPLKAEVIGIQDGDTIELKYTYTGRKAGQRTGKNIRIRLLHVNCPERGRPYYKVAKDFTSKYCFRKVVQIRHNGEFDRYGRLLGEVVIPGGKNLNKELVKNGLAVHFKKYSSNAEYANLEIQAKKQKLGIWSQPGLYSGKN